MVSNKLYGYTNKTNHDWIAVLAKKGKTSKSKVLHNLITKDKKEGWNGNGEETTNTTRQAKKTTTRNSKKAKVITGKGRTTSGKRTKVTGRKTRKHNSRK